MSKPSQLHDVDRNGAAAPAETSPGPTYAVIATAPTDRTDEIDLVDLAAGAWRRRALFLITFVVSLAAAGTFLTLQRPTVTVEVIVAAGQVDDLWASRNLANQFKDIYLPAVVDKPVAATEPTRDAEVSATLVEVDSPRDARVTVSSRTLDEAELASFLLDAWGLQQAQAQPQFDAAVALLEGEASRLASRASALEKAIANSPSDTGLGNSEVQAVAAVIDRISRLRLQIESARPDRLVAGPRRLKDETSPAILRWGVAVIGSVLVASLVVVAAFVIDATRDRLRDSSTPA